MLFRPRPSFDFESLIFPHANRLYRLSLQLAGNKADADDLIQEVLLKAFTHLPRLDPGKNIGSWLTTVLYNLFIDSCRQKKSMPVLVTTDAFDENSAQYHEADPCLESITLQKELQAQLKTALLNLSAEFRAIVVLHDVEGFGLPELETITQIPLGTLKSRLHRARRQLREEILKSDYFDKRELNKETL